MTLKQVSESSGLTEGYLSQLERGVSTGSISSLQKICAATGLEVGELFSEPDSTGPKVTRFRDSEGFSYGVKGRKLRLTPNEFDHLEMFVGVFEPGGSTGADPYSHGSSEELILVIEGQVEVTLGSQVFTLHALDSIPFSSSVPHRVKETGGNKAIVLWGMSPRSF
ncbi:cupin domain-containing protein [Brevibacterium sp. SMBL_HHYL_HB1]|nr:cupin domain-containing protein [Brevibacterium sp. SMBL_HHYL_HB1]